MPVNIIELFNCMVIGFMVIYNIKFMPVHVVGTMTVCIIEHLRFMPVYVTGFIPHMRHRAYARKRNRVYALYSKGFMHVYVKGLMTVYIVGDTDLCPLML